MSIRNNITITLKCEKRNSLQIICLVSLEQGIKTNATQTKIGLACCVGLTPHRTAPCIAVSVIAKCRQVERDLAVHLSLTSAACRHTGTIKNKNQISHRHTALKTTLQLSAEAI